ncbi:CarD family transcriptional regulator [Adlercreutzia sp. ZJ473]|uniref:CarD family transcriptional regulator n=1 Tax=Adlercreutzia sp. ZJ473 TaxID=2722822 RepID=UPI001555FBE9|nr:CarD family transcriptional regulator [Adlercreutzia sp. ZJ473]
MFAVGDTVVYRHHVCIIARVREAYFEGRDYFELHTLFEKSLKLYVAIGDAVPPVMRAPMEEDAAYELIDSILDAGTIDESILHAHGTTLSLVERQVKEEYERRLKSNDARDLIPVIKSAYERTREREDAGKRTTAVDKKFHDLAESLLYDELAVALKMDREEVDAFVKKRLAALEKKLRS